MELEGGGGGPEEGLFELGGGAGGPDEGLLKLGGGAGGPDIGLLELEGGAGGPGLFELGGGGGGALPLPFMKLLGAFLEVFLGPLEIPGGFKAGPPAPVFAFRNKIF